MKLQITKIALCLFVVLTTIACKKEDTNPTGSGNGLAPSASNNTFAQNLTIQINGNSWIATRNISGFIDLVTYGTPVTALSGVKELAGDDEALMLGMNGPSTNGNYTINAYSGSFDFFYQGNVYQFNPFTSLSNKSRIQLQILNTVLNSAGTRKYIAADFNGVVYNSFNANDSIILNGSIRFK